MIFLFLVVEAYLMGVGAYFIAWATKQEKTRWAVAIMGVASLLFAVALALAHVAGVY